LSEDDVDLRVGLSSSTARPLRWRHLQTSPSWMRLLAICRRVHPRLPQRAPHPGNPRVDQGFPSLRLHHWRISWTKRNDGSHRGPIPFFLDVTVIGRDWHIKVRVRRHLSRWQIWIRRCRRSASRCWPKFLVSSVRAQQAPLKMPHAGIPPWTRGRAAAKGRHGVIVVPRGHRLLYLPRRHRRQLTTTKTAWGPRRVPASWRS